jgi:hypothetical protein
VIAPNQASLLRHGRFAVIPHSRLEDGESDPQPYEDTPRQVPGLKSTGASSRDGSTWPRARRNGWSDPAKWSTRVLLANQGPRRATRAGGRTLWDAPGFTALGEHHSGSNGVVVLVGGERRSRWVWGVGLGEYLGQVLEVGW